MAFLCPSRVGRSTKAKSKKKDKPFAALPGRLTGSDSIDTLVRVGLEKENGISLKSKVRVIADFRPCVDEEIAVRRGDVVYMLYKENDWAYVIKRNGEEGFIPYCYCTRLFSSESISSDISNWKETLHDYNHNDSMESDVFLSEQWSDVSKKSSQKQDPVPINSKDPPPHKGIITREEMMRILLPKPEETDKPEVRPFRKTSHGQFIALFDFFALDENDITVERAELLDVLNIEDPDWSWIRRYDGNEGFVPKSYICPVEPLKAIEKAANGGHSRQSSITTTGRLSLSPSLSGRGTPTKPHQRAPNNQRMGHSYLSQPVLNVTNHTDDFQKDSNMNNLKTYVSSDTVNSHERTLRNFINNVIPSFSDSSAAIPPSTSHVITIRTPWTVSQTITQDNQPSTFKPVSTQSATESDFDDPSCASSLPGSPRIEPSQDSVNNDHQNTQSIPTDNNSNTQPLKPVNNAYLGGKYNMKTSSENLANGKSTNVGIPLNPAYDNNADVRGTKLNNVTECVLLYDYTARSQDDLTVRRGDVVYDDGRSHGNAHWVWVFSPRARDYGYVPRQYIKPLVQTSL